MASARDPLPPRGERRPIGELRLVWGLAAHYPGRIAAALTALVVASAATLAIPYGFKRVIDRGFISGGGSSTGSTAASIIC